MQGKTQTSAPAARRPRRHFVQLRCEWCGGHYRLERHAHDRPDTWWSPWCGKCQLPTAELLEFRTGTGRGFIVGPWEYSERWRGDTLWSLTADVYHLGGPLDRRPAAYFYRNPNYGKAKPFSASLNQMRWATVPGIQQPKFPDEYLIFDISAMKTLEELVSQFCCHANYMMDRRYPEHFIGGGI